MTVWGDIIASSERFAPVGARHDLQLVTNLVRGNDELEPALTVEVHGEDLALLMERTLPASDGAAWIDVLVSVVDVPEEELPHPDGWATIVDHVLEHRRALADLPVLDDDPD